MVNAAEIVSAFRGPNGLRRFRRWLDAPDDELVQLARSTAGGGRRGGGKRGGGKRGGRKNGRQQTGGGEGGPAAGASQGGGEQAGEGGGGQGGGGDEEESPGDEGPGQGGSQGSEEGSEGEGELTAEFKRKHRNVRRSWDAPASFPSEAVEQAYSQPKVDASRDK